MIKKFEACISHWCLKWILMGGRMILINSVLSYILVYWISLILILVSVVSHIIRRIFQFFWVGILDSSKFNFSSWESIALPKHLGGWWLKNMSWFNNALCAKSMWRSLFQNGLKNKVIMENYIKSSFIYQWIRDLVWTITRRLL